MEVLALILVFILAVVGTLFVRFYLAARKNSAGYKRIIEENNGDIQTLRENLRTEKSRSKSVEVKTGFIMEKISPFTKAFGESLDDVHHIGNPIDFICFHEDSIVFVEVKTGKARLTAKQNNIKRLIEEGKVRFKTVRFDYE